MLYKVTNTGEARTVDHLAVFQEGEDKVFTEDEIKAYVAMSGVPFGKGENLPEGFKVAQAKDNMSTVELHEIREEVALKEQEANVARLNGQDVPQATPDDKKENA